MKIKRATSSKKRWLIISLAVLLVTGIGAGAYALTRAAHQASIPSATSVSTSPQSTPSNVNLDKPSASETQTGNDIKAQNVNPSTSPSSQPSNDLSITADNTGTTIQVRSTLATSVQSGICKLTLTKGSMTVTQPDVGIQALSGYSTCKGWNVPVSQLSSGNWTVNATASYQSKTSTATAEVTVP